MQQMASMEALPRQEPGLLGRSSKSTPYSMQLARSPSLPATALAIQDASMWNSLILTGY